MLSLWGFSVWLPGDLVLRNPLKDSCMGRGSSGAGGRTPTGSASNPPSWCIDWGGELALGGSSLKDSAPWEEEVAEATIWGACWVLCRLKTCPSAESSSSETTSTTLLPLSRGAEEAPASTNARGTAAIGGGELGTGWGEAWVVGVVCVVAGWGWGLGEDGGAEEVEGGDAKAPSLDFSTWASRNCRCLSILESAPRRQI